MFSSFRKTEAPTDALINKILDLEKKKLQKLDNFEIAALEKRLKDLEIEVHGGDHEKHFSDGKDKGHYGHHDNNKVDTTKSNKTSTDLNDDSRRKSESGSELGHPGDYGGFKEKAGSSPSVSTSTPANQSRSISQDHSYSRMSWSQPKLSPFLGASSASTVLTATPSVNSKDKHMSLPLRRPSHPSHQSPADDEIHITTATTTTISTGAASTTAWRAHSTSTVSYPPTSLTSAQNAHILEDAAKLELERNEVLSTSPSVLEFCILEADWNKVLQLAVNHFTQLTQDSNTSPLPSGKGVAHPTPADLHHHIIVDPMILLQKYPTIPSYCTYYYPSASAAAAVSSLNPLTNHSLSASETIQKIQEQHLMFPSGIPIEIVSSTIMKYRLFGTTNTRIDYKQANNTRRYTTSQRHIIPFSNTTGHSQYACCYVTYQAYAVEEFLELFESFGVEESEDSDSSGTSAESLDALRETMGAGRDTMLDLHNKARNERIVGKDAGKLILKYIYERYQQQLACSVIQRAYRNYIQIKRDKIWKGELPTNNHTGTKSTVSGLGSEAGHLMNSKSVPGTPNRSSIASLISTPNGTNAANANANAKSAGFLSRFFRRQSHASGTTDDSSQHGTETSTHGSAVSDTEHASTAANNTPTKYRFGSLTNSNKGDSNAVGTPTTSAVDRVASTDSAGGEVEGSSAIPINFEPASSSIQQLTSIPEETNDEGYDKEKYEQHRGNSEEEEQKIEYSFPTPFVPFSRKRMKTKDIFQVLKGKYILTQKAYCMVSPLQEFPFIFQVSFILMLFCSCL
jgi:hypothetical protein